MYLFRRKSQMARAGQQVQLARSADRDGGEYYRGWWTDTPICSIEDGLEGKKVGTAGKCSQNSWEATAIQLVRGRLFVTNTKRLKKGIDLEAGV